MFSFYMLNFKNKVTVKIKKKFDLTLAYNKKFFTLEK